MKLLLRILIRDVIKRMLVRQTKISIRGGPKTGEICFITSNPIELDPKKTLTKIHEISDNVNSSLASIVNVVKKPNTMLSNRSTTIIWRLAYRYTESRRRP